MNDRMKPRNPNIANLRGLLTGVLLVVVMCFMLAVYLWLASDGIKTQYRKLDDYGIHEGVVNREPWMVVKHPVGYRKFRKHLLTIPCSDFSSIPGKSYAYSYLVRKKNARLWESTIRVGDSVKVYFEGNAVEDDYLTPVQLERNGEILYGIGEYKRREMAASCIGIIAALITLALIYLTVWLMIIAPLRNRKPHRKKKP